MGSNDHGLVEIVKDRYGSIARGEQSGCGDANTHTVARAIGYTDEDLAIAQQANLGLGCGNPLALAAIHPGMTVLDLGSGAGFDAFLAWRRVGPSGRVIGVDMTDDMLAAARKNAIQLGANNVEFRKGRIEELPAEDASVDLVISNCVINLSTDKARVFREIFRVLKPGGEFAVSDLVLLRPLPAEIESDVNAYVGCVAGASLLTDYLRMAFDAGFTDVSIPQITPGGKLLVAYGMDARPSGSCCGSSPSENRDWVKQAAETVISAKVHGRRAK
jgi:arsenite methyltransferase